MATIRYPFQKLCSTGSSGDRGPFLFAACGPDILTFLVSSGKIASRWSVTSQLGSSQAEDSEHPSKRRKVEHEQNGGSQSRQESEESIEIKVERHKGERKKAKAEQSRASNVSHLVATSDGQTLISVTADDKTIRVFDIEGESGSLVVKSSRLAHQTTISDETHQSEKKIVVGDKFGDVYSLPLHPSKDYVRPKTGSQAFQPSATELTVHTKGNLEALRQQREQKNISPRKEAPEFEYRLLLGHVSLLTDVLVATSAIGQKKRAFTITSDRDEHIRISRCPQGHVIEGYCLGHRDFVSQMRIPEWSPEYLISGGGEPSMKVFDWRNGVLVSEENFQDDRIKAAVAKALASSNDERTLDKLAVSAIWAIGMESTTTGNEDQKRGLILAAFEGLPLVLSFSLGTNGRLNLHQIIETNSNVLDLASLAERDLIIISLDTAHEKGSTRSFKAESSSENGSLEAFELETTQKGWVVWKPADIVQRLNAAIAGIEDRPVVIEAERTERQRAKSDYSALGEFLYGLENLRKKRGQTAEDVEAEAEQEVEDGPAAEYVDA
ncbi:hypothetical protein DV736_g5249, partial [Chaetothyriales sp. CBS 134916]